MRRLLNTLFVTSEDAYLTLDGENIVVRRKRRRQGGFLCTIWKRSSASPMPGLRLP